MAIRFILAKKSNPKSDFIALRDRLKNTLDVDLKYAGLKP